MSAAVIIPKEDGVISVSDDRYACTFVLLPAYYTFSSILLSYMNG